MPYAEFIVASIAALNDFHNPESKAFRLRNPLLLKSYAPSGRHAVDEDGIRIYESFLSGLKSATVDVELKLSGKSITGLTSDQTLQNLLKVLNVKTKEQQAFVVRFLRLAMDDKSISLTTSLRRFLG